MTLYGHRVALVEATLKRQKVHPAKNRTLTEAAAAVLAAVDTISESMR